VAPGDTNTFYVGSEVGVYGTSTGGASWSTGNDGPANVAVDQLFWLGPKLIAVTHGRGMFSIIPVVGPPNIAANGFTLNDANANGAVDPNECSQVYLFLRNTNGPTATNVTATLASTTPGLFIIQGSSAYPNIPVGGTVTNLTPFQFSTGAGFACGATVSLTLTVSANGTNSVVPFTLPSSGTYALVQSNGVAIVPGTSDTGNHGQNVLTPITLPFPYTYYGRTFTNATLCSNGNLQFLGGNFAAGGVCLPVGGLNYPIFPFWDNLRTDLGTDGIYTSVTGTSPNRTFNIEWRAALVSSSAEVDFEIVLFENQARVDFIYGPLGDPGNTATVGIQRDTGSAYSNFGCSAGGLSPGLQLSYQLQCTDGGGQCAPFIVTPPVSRTIAAGSNANFTVTASSSAPLYYQWRFNSTPITGATDSAYTRTNAQCADAGGYDVVVTNSGGSVVSAPATLTVVTPPVILIQPTNVAALVGQTATLQTTATNDCGGGLRYQWILSPFSLPNATNSSLVISNAQFSDTGDYFVIVSDVAGSVTSSVAHLTVVTSFAPTILSPALSNGNFTFSFQSIAGKTYVVQYTDDLQAASWLTLQTIPGDGSLKSVVTPVAASPRRFYRLSVQ
jgi:hypothetical protein